MASMEIYSIGPSYCCVCSDDSIQRVKQFVEQQPCCSGYRWVLSKQSFDNGRRNPCKCDVLPDYKHYLFEAERIPVAAVKGVYHEFCMG